MSLPTSIDFFRDLLAEGVDAGAAHAFVAAYGELLQRPQAITIQGGSIQGGSMQDGSPHAGVASHGVRPPQGFGPHLGFELPDDGIVRRFRLEWSVSPGDLADIPDPRCVASHLPRDRKPTREEIDKAIKACRKMAV